MTRSRFLTELLEIRALFTGKVNDHTLDRFLRFPHRSNPWNKIWLYERSPWEESLVFLPLGVACHEALQTVGRKAARTWGDYVRDCDPEDTLRQTLASVFEDDPPADTDEFDEAQVDDMSCWPVCGSFLFWPEQWMIDELPGDIQDNYGKVETTVHDGPVVTYHLTYRNWILDEFEEMGHLVVHDPVLIDACENDPGNLEEIRNRVAWYRSGKETLSRLDPATLARWEGEIQTPLPARPDEDDEIEIEHDTWLKGEGNPRPLPEDGVFVISYEAAAQGVAEYKEAVFFRRTTNRDEIWTARDSGLGRLPYCNHQDTKVGQFNESDFCMTGLAAWARRRGNARDAAYRLLSAHLDSVSHCSRMMECQTWGLFECSDYKAIVDQNHRRWKEARAESDRQRDTISAPILDTVRELGLHLEGAGHDPHSWNATCPGTNHSLVISSRSNEFGCGYCKVKGGVDELRALVAKRK